MGTTPPTHACAVRFMNFSAETKFEKGASDRNSPTVVVYKPRCELVEYFTESSTISLLRHTSELLSLLIN